LALKIHLSEWDHLLVHVYVLYAGFIWRGAVLSTELGKFGERTAYKTE
jgi:hypothetical protein